ncbi:MAG: N-acetylmuramoyl-L-alanine amidase family protein [Betaproteobacteria bacterium]
MEVRQQVRTPLVILVLARRKLAAALALVLTGAGFVGGALAAIGYRTAATRPLTGHIIAIDPGHGGIDSGATHPASALAEKEITLDVARRLGRLVKQAGGRAILTRTDDWESDLPDRAELRRRAAIAEGNGAEILLSLHVDAHADSSCEYGQVFYHPSSIEGRRLAQALQAELLRLRPGNYRRVGAADFYLLRCTKIPSVLVEMGFLSHPEERRLLNSGSYRQEVALALLRGITVYFSQPPPPSVGRRWPEYGPPAALEQAW